MTAGLILQPANSQDPRRFDLPSQGNDEVAALVPPGERHPPPIRLTLRPGKVSQPGHFGFDRIKITNPQYCPLHYVLFFPWCDLGWSYYLYLQINTRIVKVTHYPLWSITAIASSRFRSFNPLHHGSRLFQQFVVYLWAVFDERRIKWPGTTKKNYADCYSSGLKRCIVHGCCRSAR